MKIPRLVIAGTNSGVGKTLISCAVIHGIKKRGYSVQPFKVGPDYIDPSYLSSISKNETRNLDAWLMGERELIASFTKNSNSDYSIIEGVMGFYDGLSGSSNFSSTHHVASLLNAPVILVLDASKTARSIAATVLGFKKFHKNSNIIGLILNKLGSKKHEMLCKQALDSIKIPIVGLIPKDSEHSLPSRHLGLIPVTEQTLIKNKIQTIAKKISDYIDINKLIKISNNVSSLPKYKNKKIKNTKTTIAVALDNSFNFYYQDNLEALRREGAKIEFFSPISNSKIPNCDGIYIGGGFPEILGNLLQKNLKMKKSIKNLAEKNIPIYAECGGLMYLTRSITYQNKKYNMVGLFDVDTKMTKKMTLNYTKGQIKSNCIISTKSKNFRGHEFHYSEIDSIPHDSKFAYKLSIGEGIKNKQDGLIDYSTLASYGHLYFDSSDYAQKFVEQCIRTSKR
ncbi:MAG TPA: cobyrinate a,c-diamide synthase [Nitrosopumilaceae archaeon]|nr:cobyrinate a,c-diamide synthase [Nitrosopumilaceae archaeon]